MRLYVNTKEVPYLKNALRNAIAQTWDSETSTRLTELLERVSLCEDLQKNERRALNKGGYIDVNQQG
jgi:hypothetical protein